MGLLGLAGLLFVAGLAGLLGTLLAEESTRRQTDDRLTLARLIASILDYEFEEQYALMDSFAERADVDIGDLPSQRLFLQRLLRQSEAYVIGVYLTDATGRIAGTEPADLGRVGADLSDRPEFSVPMTAGVRYASAVHADDRGQPRVVFSVPVRGADGGPLGTLGAVLDPSRGELEVLAIARHLGGSGHGELVDQDHRVIASSEPRYVLRLVGNSDSLDSLLARRTSGVVTAYLPAPEDQADGEDQAGGEASRDGGQSHVLAFVPLNSVPWGLSLGGSEVELGALADRWRWYVAPLAGLAVLLALGLGWVTASSIAVPVRALTRVSGRIAAGDLTTPVDRIGEGEVRSLSEAFDQMRRRLWEAQDALALEKSRYQGIVESMADAVVTIDADGRVTALNPAAELLTGWSAQEAIGRQCSEVLPPAGERDSPVCLASLYGQSTVAPEELPRVAEVGVRRRDGRRLAVALTRSAIQSSDGAPQGLVYVLRDVSAAEELSRLKDEFLSTVSHELRTPLGLIKGYAGTLLEPDAPYDEDLARRCLWVIVEASDQLDALVDQLLDMSKIQAGALTVEPEHVRLESVAQNAVEQAQMLTRDHHVQLHLLAQLPPVLVDRPRLAQVLGNLLDNAIKYSPNGGQIDVSAEVSESEVIVSVTDEGIGVAKEEVSRLFERFYRGSVARSRQIGGSGLGLAICKGIVEAHGGRIWADSPAPGRPPGVTPGTRVSFTLPLARTDGSSAGAQNGSGRARAA